MKKFHLLLTCLAALALNACSPSNYKGGGTLKTWLEKRVQKDGFELKWNINGDYDVTPDQEKFIDKFSIGQLTSFVTQSMTSDNFARYATWVAKNDKTPYPYFIYVVAAQCENKIVFAQVAEPMQYTKDLEAGKFGKCTSVPFDLGIKKTTEPPLEMKAASVPEETKAASTPNKP